MGLFVTNLHVRSSSKSEVIQALGRLLTQPAFISKSEEGWISVFPAEVEGQDVERLEYVSQSLSREFETETLALLLHDSDVFMFWLYGSGDLKCDYNSIPDYFTGGNTPPQLSEPATLARIAKAGVSQADLERCLLPLRLPIFGDELVAGFASLIGINPDLALSSYNCCDDDSTDLDPEEHGIEHINPAR